MFFKSGSFTSLVGLSAGLFLFSSCEIKFNQSPGQSAQSLSMGGGSSTSCVSKDTHGLMDRYFEGTASETQINQFFSCAARSFGTFTSQVRGKKKGAYTPRELANFLETYFISDFKLSNEVLDQAMELKVALLGGTREEVTKEEFDQIRILVDEIRVQSVALRTLFPLSKFERLSDLDWVSAALLNSVDHFGKVLSSSARYYSFTQLDRLLSAVSQIRGTGFSARDIQDYRSQIPLLKSLKSIVIRPDGDLIVPFDWQVLFSSVARAYVLKLKAHAFMNDPRDITSTEVRQAFVQLSDEFMGFLRDAARRHPYQTIHFEEFNELFRNIEMLYPDALPVSSRSLEVTIRPLVRKMLDKPKGVTEIEGLSVTAIDGLTNVIHHWSAGQYFIETLFSHFGGDFVQGYPSQDLLKFSMNSLFPAIRSLEQVVFDSAEKIREILKLERPFFYQNDTQISFAHLKGSNRYSFHNLSEANWIHEASTLLIKGYNHQNLRRITFDSGVPLEGIREFTADIRDLGIEMKILDADDRLVPEKRFREANLFTFIGNGDDKVSEEEGAQLLMFLLSGKRLSNHIHATLSEACHGHGKDPWDYPLIPTDCYRKKFFAGIHDFWKNFPDLILYYEALSEEDRVSFETVWEMAGRKKGVNAEEFNSSDSEGYAMLPHYIETIFERFDIDHSGTLSSDEAERAFPVFKRTIKGLIQDQDGPNAEEPSDSKAQMVFNYILAKGKRPSGAWDVITFRGKSVFGRREADRGTLVRIFAELSSPPGTVVPGQ